jgi:hypothetical protein
MGRRYPRQCTVVGLSPVPLSRKPSSTHLSPEQVQCAITTGTFFVYVCVCVYILVRIRTQIYTHTHTRMCIHIYVYTYIYPSTSTYIDTHTNTHTHPHPHTQVKKRLLLKTASSSVLTSGNRYTHKWQQGDKWFEIRLVSDVGTLNEGDVIEIQHLGLVQVTNIVWCVIHTYIPTYIPTRIHSYTHTHTHTYTHTHTHTHTYAGVCSL